MKTQLPSQSLPHSVEISAICDAILKSYRDQIAFIILFGSFARGNWVYDSYTEQNIHYQYASDYDFLVITKTSKGASCYRLEQGISSKLNKFPTGYARHSPSVIVHSLKYVNEELAKARYFFTDIIHEGVCLYSDSGYELGEAREASELDRQTMQQEAEDYFKQAFESASGFLRDSKYALNINDNKKSAFYLHQATETFYKCTLLVFTLYTEKSHDIEKLGKQCAKYSREFLNIFPKNTKEQQQNFDLLKNAYIDARYKKYYNISPQQLNALISNVEKLQATVKTLCEAKITSIARGVT